MADEMNETPEAVVESPPVVEAPVAPVAPAVAEGEQQVAPRGEGRRFTPGAKRFPRRKVCVFCVDKIDYVDYKDVKRLRKFVTERGKILPRRISGNCAAHQRMLTGAVKRARVIALLPFRGE